MKITLRFIRDTSVISELIGWQTFGKWSHVEFCLPDGYLGSQAPEGVKLRPWDYCKPSEELRCTVEVPTDVGKRILAFARAQIGKPYDYKSIAGFIMRRDWTDANAWFCSELVAASFKHAGHPLLRTEECNRISPSTLSLSPLLYVVEKKDSHAYSPFIRRTRAASC